MDLIEFIKKYKLTSNAINDEKDEPFIKDGELLKFKRLTKKELKKKREPEINQAPAKE
jgi:hypothetical protein